MKQYDHLPDFLSALEDAGELVRVAGDVDPDLELAAIARRLCERDDGGPAVLFERVRGSVVPVVANLLGSRTRLCRALRCESFNDVAARVAALIHPDVPEGWLDMLRLVPQFAQLAKLPPRTVKTGLCQQVVKLGRDVNLGELPVPRSWPGEAGPVITAGILFTRHPSTGIREVELVPLEVRGRDALLVHWDRTHHGRRIFEEYRRRQVPMPVAVALGGDPVYTYMAHAPLPPQTDACLFGGFLRGANIDLVRCRSIELDVPADAEFVIEGHIDTVADLEPGGPIALPTGFYGEREPIPRMSVTALTHRSNPVFPAMIPGPPPVEEDWLHQATERIFLPLVQLFLPELVDLHRPRAGAYRNFAFASIRKESPQQARQVMNALWGLDRLAATKFLVVVDADVDVHDEERVWFHVGANAHPGRDVVFNEGPTHPADHAAPIRGLGHKLGIDATRKLPDEGHPRPWPEPLALSPELSQRVARKWAELGLGQ